MLGLISRLIRSERGTAIILVVMGFTVLLGTVAFAVDAGMLYLEHTRLARAADAAVLAGGQELPDTVKARSEALEYITRNDVDASGVTVGFSPDNKEITVSMTKTVDLYFARFIGFTSLQVTGRATARISPVVKVKGIIPVGINEILLPLSVGSEYEIKAGAHSNVQGWREVLEYPGENGATDYRDTSFNGYFDVVQINDVVGKAPGNMSGPTVQGLQARIDACSDGCTWDNYQPGCPRVVLVPIYRDLSTQNVKIVGFASVFLERVVGNGQDSEVYATYINYSVPGETDDTVTNSYLNSVRLVQ